MIDKLLDFSLTLCKGLPVTLSLGIAGVLSAFILAICLTLLLSVKSKLITSIIRGYIILFTGTPLLVQIFLVYYGPNQFSYMRKYVPFLWDLLSHPWFCAYLALTLNSAAYTTQIFYGSLKAMPIGQWQACEALGMNKAQTLKIVMPYALKRSLSSYSNEIVFVIKGTALASTITLMDVMGYNQYLISQYYEFSAFIATGLIYLLINGVLSIIMRIIENKALAFDN